MSMNHNYHHAAGLPEWATQQEAGEACEALGIDPANLPLAVESEAGKKAQIMRQQWANAAAYYWAAAYAAMTDRNFRLMRENARIADDASEKASPSGALLAAIFGGCESAAPARQAAIGAKMPVDQVAAARKAVLAEISAYDKAVLADEATKLEKLRCEQRSARAELDAVRASELPKIGEFIMVSRPYKLAKITEGLAWYGDWLVAVNDCPQGSDIQVRVSSHRSGRAYGKKYSFEATRV